MERTASLKLVAAVGGAALAASFLILLVASVGPARAQAAGATDQQPTLVGSWGDYGSEDEQFEGASGLVTDSSGNVYVADTYNHRIQKFDSHGDSITKWGELGIGDGEFYYPEGVATDSSDNVYVADTSNGRVQKFDSDGNFVSKWDSPGEPQGIATDSSGNVYVVGWDGVQKFDSDGNLITTWGSSYGSGDGQFNSPADIATDSSGDVYVADTYNHRVQKFDSDGSFITKWGFMGVDDGEFYRPRGIVTDSSGNVYVADTSNGRVQKFNTDGSFVTKWDIRDPYYDDLSSPRDVATTSSGNNIYVADYSSIQRFGSDNAPPVTTAKATTSDGGTYESGSRTTGEVTVDLAATDNEGSAAVKEITYTLTHSWGHSWTDTERGSSVSIPVDYSEGEATLITYYATDYAGNREAEQTFTVGQDQNLPEVWDTNPAYGATGVSRATNITVDLSEEMDRTTLTDSTVQLYQKYAYQVRKKKGKKVRRVWTYKWVSVNDARVSCDEQTCQTLTLDPPSDLAANTNYLAVVTTGVKDKAGNALAENYSWTFTTGSS